MIRMKRGSIVNVSSTSSIMIVTLAYDGKASLSHATKIMATELDLLIFE